MNSTLTSLIKKWQRAYSQGNIAEFIRLRNRVNRERKACRAKYYEASVQHLRQCKPSAWWKEVKRLSGMKSPCGKRDGIVEYLKQIDGAQAQQQKTCPICSTRRSYHQWVVLYRFLRISALDSRRARQPKLYVLTVTTGCVFEKVSRPRWNTTVVVKRKYGLIA